MYRTFPGKMQKIWSKFSLNFLHNNYSRVQICICKLTDFPLWRGDHVIKKDVPSKRF
jgi:hypothetical protein